MWSSTGKGRCGTKRKRQLEYYGGFLDSGPPSHVSDRLWVEMLRSYLTDPSKGISTALSAFAIRLSLVAAIVHPSSSTAQRIFSKNEPE